MTQKIKLTSKLAPLVLTLCLVILNARSWQGTSRVWGGVSTTAFTDVRGWPFPAAALANDEGAFEVDASIVQGDTRVKRRVFSGLYPHLAWNPTYLIGDILVAVLLVAVFWLITRRLVAWLSNKPLHPTGGDGG